MLEIIGVNGTGGGVLVGLDVVRIRLDLELDALLRENRRRVVGKDHGVRARRGAHNEGLGGGCAGASCGTDLVRTAAAGSKRTCGNESSGACNERATGNGSILEVHNLLLY